MSDLDGVRLLLSLSSCCLMKMASSQRMGCLCLCLGSWQRGSWLFLTRLMVPRWSPSMRKTSSRMSFPLVYNRTSYGTVSSLRLVKSRLHLSVARGSGEGNSWTNLLHVRKENGRYRYIWARTLCVTEKMPLYQVGFVAYTG